MAAADLVFIDESGASLRLTRPYGRVPRNHGKPTSLVSAPTPGGLRAQLRRELFVGDPLIRLDIDHRINHRASVQKPIVSGALRLIIPPHQCL